MPPLCGDKRLRERERAVAVCSEVQTSTERKSGHLLLPLSISSVFAHTWCISPSVCPLKSFMQASTFAPSPFSARASAIRSRTCGRQRLAFLAVSATGGARKPNPSEGGEGATAPCTEFAKMQTAVKPAGRAALIRHGAAIRRAVPPSPRGRLSAPSHSVSTREPRSALHLPQCAQGS